MRHYWTAIGDSVRLVFFLPESQLQWEFFLILCLSIHRSFNLFGETFSQELILSFFSNMGPSFWVIKTKQQQSLILKKSFIKQKQEKSAKISPKITTFVFSQEFLAPQIFLMFYSGRSRLILRSTIFYLEKSCLDKIRA